MTIRMQLELIWRYVHLVPQVRNELKIWRTLASRLPTPLREQALASIKEKEFHCLGGAVYALYPGANTSPVLRAIVALQTISDYLDNLCDRLSITDDTAFRMLHNSFLDALLPGKPLQDYYRYYPHQEQMYLSQLVSVCQKALASLPRYESYLPAALRLGQHYCELQIRKHAGQRREELLLQWINESFPDNRPWQEWAAASGSTLGIFALFALASIDTRADTDKFLRAYFPYIQALHIMLDYLIDQEEDREHGDLNFTFYYTSQAELLDALSLLVWESRKRAMSLPHPAFHRTVIDGLIALYGSDPKVKSQRHGPIFKKLSRDSSAVYLLPACSALRRLRII